MFFEFVDRTLVTKNDVRDHLLALAAHHECRLSKSRANKLADRFKRGDFDPTLVAVTSWADPTGETACDNVMREEWARAQEVENA